MGFLEMFQRKTKQETLTEEEKRKHRCAFTGHRPEKLQVTEEDAKALLRCEIQNAVDEGYSVFITGMARGVDIWAAEIVVDLREKNKDLKLICAVPYKGFEQRWAGEWQRRYQSILDRADYVRVLKEGYSPSVFQLRNMWMVNHASRLIAFYNGEPGGTRNTIEYARDQKIDVRIIN